MTNRLLKAARIAESVGIIESCIDKYECLYAALLELTVKQLSPSTVGSEISARQHTLVERANALLLDLSHLPVVANERNMRRGEKRLLCA